MGTCSHYTPGGGGHARGFSLVEVVLAIGTLALAGAAVSAVFMAGSQSLGVQADDLRVQSALRSAMEEIVATPFATVTNGTPLVVIGGKSYTGTVSVALVDLDGDSVPEPTAKRVTVSLRGGSLQTILVDHEGRAGKL